MLRYFAENKETACGRYSAEDMVFRWKKLQRVVEKEGSECLLLITGPDGGDNQHTTYLFSWLFLGLCGNNILANKFLDPIYSEMVVVVGAKSSFIFITPEAKTILQPLLYALPNTTVYCPTPTQYSNKEQLDVLKIAFFYRATYPFKNIAVHLANGAQPKSIEKWPLVQSYALEQVGSTFFTIHHTLTNIHPKVQPLFKNLDKHALRMILGRTTYSLQGHIKGTTQMLEYTPLPHRHLISQSKLQESLAESVDSTQDNIRVLFGERSLQNLPSNDTVYANSFHAIIQHVDPCTKIAVWRTYFLDNLLPTQLLLKTIQQESADSFIVNTQYALQSIANAKYEAYTTTLLLYKKLIQSVLDAITIVSKDYRHLSTKFLTQHISKGVGQDIFLQLEGYDAFGDPKPIDFKDSISFKLSTTYYVLKCKVKDVVFSQCFLLQQGCYLLLTKTIDYFDFCKCSADPKQALQQLNPNYKFPELGQSRKGVLNGRMIVMVKYIQGTHFSLPMLSVKYWFHQHGVRIYSDKTGWMLILYSQIVEAVGVDRVPGQWLVLHLQKSLLFEPIQQKRIAIQCRGAYEILQNRIPSIRRDIIDNMPQLGEYEVFAREILRKKSTPLNHHQILQQQFLWQFLQAKQLIILKQMKDLKLSTFRGIYQNKNTQVPNTKQQIILIVGSYGTNGVKIAHSINSCAVVPLFPFSIASNQQYSKMQLKTFLQCLHQSAPPNITLLVVVPSWLTSTQLYSALQQQYCIRTVVAVVSTGNFFLSPNQQLVENILAYTLPGYSQLIVLDTHGQSQSLISHVNRVVWGANRSAKVMRSSNAVLSTAQCKDILSDCSYLNEGNAFLRSKYACLHRFQSANQLTLHYLKFNLPVIKPIQLREEGYIMEEKKKEVIGDAIKDELMLSLYHLGEKMAVERRKQKAMQVRCVKGVLRTEEQYLDILVANGMVVERTVTESKEVGVSVLARRYNEVDMSGVLETMTRKGEILSKVIKEKKVEDITLDEKLCIQRENREKYFENGEFYDGSFYRDVEGNILPQHPQSKRLVQEAIVEINKRIEEHNKNIYKEWEKYCEKYC